MSSIYIITSQSSFQSSFGKIQRLFSGSFWYVKERRVLTLKRESLLHGTNHSTMSDPIHSSNMQKTFQVSTPQFSNLMHFNYYAWLLILHSEQERSRMVWTWYTSYLRVASKMSQLIRDSTGIINIACVDNTQAGFNLSKICHSRLVMLSSRNIQNISKSSMLSMQTMTSKENISCPRKHIGFSFLICLCK